MRFPSNQSQTGAIAPVTAGILLGLFASWGAAQQPADPAMTNSVGMELVRIPAGQFTMGSRRDFNDRPTRTVELTRPFLMSSCEVTQKQFREIMGYNPSWFAYKGDGLPVECASWFEAVEFCRRLGKREGRKYRLPTEAEWEYACKAGVDWMAATGPEEPEGVAEYAWTPGNTGTETRPVGTKKPNPWGLHDMLGNVYEWCADWYDDISYRGAETVDPQGPANSSNTLDQGGRVARGGSSLGGGMNCLRTNRCSSTARNTWTPYAKHRALGFRIVCEIE
jgi:formylglycine-generating enzyme required for sulfatase activity